MKKLVIAEETLHKIPKILPPRHDLRKMYTLDDPDLEYDLEKDTNNDLSESED